MTIEADRLTARTAPMRLDEFMDSLHPFLEPLAREKGIDLAAVAGSGPHGRVIMRDVAAAKPGAAPAAAPPAAATATGAAAVTSNSVSNALTNSVSSTKDISLN